jgi:hypothetical protein
MPDDAVFSTNCISFLGKRKRQICGKAAHGSPVVFSTPESTASHPAQLVLYRVPVRVQPRETLVQAQ